MESSEGLIIKKHTYAGTVGQNFKFHATPDDGYFAAIQRIAGGLNIKASKAADDDIGLGFVSEKEVRGLLQLLSELEPY